MNPAPLPDDLTPANLLADLLDDANHAPWESVQSALARVSNPPHPHIDWLTKHLSETKRAYWTIISSVTGLADPPPPDEAGLTRLMVWEVSAARQLTPEQLAPPLDYGGLPFTVASFLRFGARHTAWHAGQIAALARREQLA